MGKIVCESCGTEFKFEVAKDLENCPVCGASFSEETDNDNGVQDEGLMYFDEIMVFKNQPEYNNVCAYCKECGHNNLIELKFFDELKDKEYVILKPDVVLKCKGCGKEHKPRKIMYKLKDHYYSILPHCPACNSINVKKIKVGSKFLAAATMCAFAVPKKTTPNGMPLNASFIIQFKRDNHNSDIQLFFNFATVQYNLNFYLRQLRRNSI